MSYHTTTEQFISTGGTAVTLIPNTGTISISILVGTNYQEVQSYTENASTVICGRGVKFQVNVTGDAEYEVN